MEKHPKLFLKVPNISELDFRQRLYADKKTMDFQEDVIDFEKSLWKPWFEKWVQKPDRRFYAYIIDKESGEPVGDVNYHFDEQFDCVMIGVVILAKWRGKGFAQEGLKLLIEKAKLDGVKKIANFFPKSREVAVHIHKKLGFVENANKSTQNDVFLELTLQ